MKLHFQNQRLQWLIGGVAAALLIGGAVIAQEVAGEAPAAPVAPAKPIAALITANADRGLLLGIAKAGDEMIAVGGNGVIVRSTDGRSWSQVASPIDTALNAVTFADAQHGWAVGHDAVILGTTDGGANWAIQNFQPELYAPIFAVHAIDAQTVFAVGAFGMIKVTADGGKHWANVDAPAISEEKLHINAIARLADGKLVVAGEHGLVGVSVDGLQWKRLTTPYEGSFFGILPWGAKGAIAFGMRGNVYRNDDLDAGSWHKVETGTTASYFGGERLDDGRLVLTGAEGSVMVIDGEGHAAPAKDLKFGANDATLTGSLLNGEALVVVGETGARQLPKL